jgi:peptide/nickel transport system permease protein
MAGKESVFMVKSSYFKDVAQRFFRHKLAMIGLFMIVLEVLLIFILPVAMDLNAYMSTASGFGAAPGAGHPLGTDDVGRDNLARLLEGGKTSLYVGLFSSLISLLIGVPLGLLSGHFRSAIEAVVMRLADVFMSFPSMILILVLVSVVGPSINSVTAVIGVMGWPAFAKLLYANVLSVREKDYVEAARAIGTKNLPVIILYILPNSFAPVLVAFTFSLAGAIISESTLSFLGMGVQPPQASWGNILYAAQSIAILARRPWMWLPAGLALLITVLSINFFGDGMRDALDPKMKI